MASETRTPLPSIGCPICGAEIPVLKIRRSGRGRPSEDDRLMAEALAEALAWAGHRCPDGEFATDVDDSLRGAFPPEFQGSTPRHADVSATGLRSQ